MYNTMKKMTLKYAIKRAVDEAKSDILDVYDWENICKLVQIVALKLPISIETQRYATRLSDMISAYFSGNSTLLDIPNVYKSYHRNKHSIESVLLEKLFKHTTVTETCDIYVNDVIASNIHRKWHSIPLHNHESFASLFIHLALSCAYKSKHIHTKCNAYTQTDESVIDVSMHNSERNNNSCGIQTDETFSPMSISTPKLRRTKQAYTFAINNYKLSKETRIKNIFNNNISKKRKHYQSNNDSHFEPTIRPLNTEINNYIQYESTNNHVEETNRINNITFDKNEKRQSPSNELQTVKTNEARNEITSRNASQHIGDQVRNVHNMYTQTNTCSNDVQCSNMPPLPYSLTPQTLPNDSINMQVQPFVIPCTNASSTQHDDRQSYEIIESNSMQLDIPVSSSKQVTNLNFNDIQLQPFTIQCDQYLVDNGYVCTNFARNINEQVNEDHQFPYNDISMSDDDDDDDDDEMVAKIKLPKQYHDLLTQLLQVHNFLHTLATKRNDVIARACRLKRKQAMRIFHQISSRVKTFLKIISKVNDLLYEIDLPQYVIDVDYQQQEFADFEKHHLLTPNSSINEIADNLNCLLDSVNTLFTLLGSRLSLANLFFDVLKQLESSHPDTYANLLQHNEVVKKFDSIRQQYERKFISATAIELPEWSPVKTVDTVMMRHHDEVTRLTEDLEDEYERRFQVNKELQECTAKLNECRNDIKFMKSIIAEREESLNSCQKDKDAINNKLKQLEQKYDKKDTELNESLLKLDEMNNELKECEKLLTAKTNNILAEMNKLHMMNDLLRKENDVLKENSCKVPEFDTQSVSSTGENQEKRKRRQDDDDGPLLRKILHTQEHDDDDAVYLSDAETHLISKINENFIATLARQSEPLQFLQVGLSAINKLTAMIVSNKFDGLMQLINNDLFKYNFSELVTLATKHRKQATPIDYIQAYTLLNAYKVKFEDEIVNYEEMKNESGNITTTDDK